MKFFRTNETSGRRQWLFRPIRRDNGRLVLVRGQAPAQKPVGQAGTQKSMNLNRCPRCPRCEDLENQTTNAQESYRICFRTCTIVSVIIFIIVLPFFVFGIVSLAAFFYREDLSTAEKWKYLTG